VAGFVELSLKSAALFLQIACDFFVLVKFGLCTGLHGLDIGRVNVDIVQKVGFLVVDFGF